MKAERKTWNTEYFILDIGTIDVMWDLNKEQRSEEHTSELQSPA